MTHDIELHVARSRCVDAFADAEKAVADFLGRRGAGGNGEMFGQKIELVRSLDASPQYSRKTRDHVLELMDALEARLPARADVVHAPLQVVTIRGAPAACFVNPRNRGELGDIARIMNADQFKRLQQELADVTDKLSRA